MAPEETRESWFGRWWLPQEPDQPVPGVLEKDESGRFTLNLIGQFASLPWDASRVPVVHGQADDQVVTLLNAYELQRRQSSFSGGPDMQRILANRVLFGVLMETPDEALFTGATLQIENLLHFLYPDRDGAVFGGGEALPDGSFSPHTATVDRFPREEFTFGEDDEAVVFRAWAQQWSFGTRRSRSSNTAEATTTAMISIRPARSRPLAHFDRYIKNLMDLLTLASGVPCGPMNVTLTWTSDALVEETTELQASLADGGESIPDGGWSVPEQEARLRGSTIHNAQPDAPPHANYQFLFTCRAVPFSTLGPIWMDLVGRLRPGLDIMLAQVYAGSSFLEAKTFEVASAAESIHRELYGGELLLMLPDTFQAMRQDIQASITEDEWTLIEKQIRNDGSFAARMEDLLNQQNQQTVDLLIPDREDWVRYLKERRNWFAHGLKVLRRKPGLEEEQGLHMRYLIRQTQLLLRLELARRLGVPGEQQYDYVKRDQELELLTGGVAALAKRSS